jgi:hypothetical protein
MRSPLHSIATVVNRNRNLDHNRNHKHDLDAPDLLDRNPRPYANYVLGTIESFTIGRGLNK